MKRFFTPIVFFAFLFPSCTKYSNSITGVLGDSIYNDVYIASNQVIGVNFDYFQVSATASFKDNVTGQLNRVQLLKINDRVLSPNPDNTYSYPYADSSTTTPEGLALAGTNIRIKITGFSSADTVSQMLYLHKNLARSAGGYFPDGTIDINKTQTLNWVPDTNDPNGKMIIQLLYQPGASHLSDSTLPANINSLIYTVPDNGSYTLPHAGLQVFPNKSYIEVYLSRVIQQVALLPVSGRKVYCFGVSSASTPPLYVINQ